MALPRPINRRADQYRNDETLNPSLVETLRYYRQLHNVYPFLDNCLRSVRQAMQFIDGEIIVVDNASVDGTAQQVRQHFPDVHLIANQDNRGFARANNQGIVAAKGEFILLLNQP